MSSQDQPVKRKTRESAKQVYVSGHMHPNLPEIGSLWIYPKQGGMLVEVTGHRGPKWNQSVMWRLRGQKQEGVVQISAFHKTFISYQAIIESRENVQKH